MDNFVYEDEILDEDGVPVEIYADEPETTMKVWQTTVAETTAKAAEAQTKKSVPVYSRTEYLAPETELTTITEVHSDEFTHTEELPLQAEKEMAVTAVTEVPQESETEETETAVSSVPSETGVSETVTEVTTLEAVTSTETSAITVVPETAEKVSNQSNSIAGFLLLAGVFGAAVAAAVYFMKNKKKNGNSMETLKRQFMRMQSPSAFGAARRFDSASFMNVPPKWPAGMPPTTSFHPFS